MKLNKKQRQELLYTKLLTSLFDEQDDIIIALAPTVNLELIADMCGHSYRIVAGETRIFQTYNAGEMIAIVERLYPNVLASQFPEQILGDSLDRQGRVVHLGWNWAEFAAEHTEIPDDFIDSLMDFIEFVNKFV
jgi:hypothetical protein